MPIFVYWLYTHFPPSVRNLNKGEVTDSQLVSHKWANLKNCVLGGPCQQVHYAHSGETFAGIGLYLCVFGTLIGFFGAWHWWLGRWCCRFMPRALNPCSYSSHLWSLRVLIGFTLSSLSSIRNHAVPVNGLHSHYEPPVTGRVLLIC